MRGKSLKPIIRDLHPAINSVLQWHLKKNGSLLLKERKTFINTEYPDMYHF